MLISLQYAWCEELSPEWRIAAMSEASRQADRVEFGGSWEWYETASEVNILGMYGA